MSKKHTVAKSAAMIATFTLLSKGLGFIREVMIASRYGSGMETDTYFVSMTATILIVGTLGAALNTTLIPIFSEIGEKRGTKGQLKYLNNVLNLVFLSTLILAILGFIFSPFIIKILAKGFEGEQFDLAVRLNRVGLPIIIFLGFTHVLSGFLHSKQIFGPHAIMGFPYNAVFLIYLFFFSRQSNIAILMGVSVIAASTQFLIQVPAVKHLGYRYSLNVNLKDPYLKKAMMLIIPVLLGSAVQQINVIIDKTLASDLAKGSISALTYSSRINELIISVFVAAIATVVFPMLSSAFSRKEDQVVKDIFKQGVNIILIITIPATIGIMLLAKPMVFLFFQRGAFDDLATTMTSGALVFYAIGLVGASLRLMLNKVFYSFQDTRTPMINGVIAVILNLILNFVFIGSMQHRGLALATSISTTITTVLLFLALRRKLGPLGLGNMLSTFIKTLFSALVMGAVVYLLYYKLGSLLPEVKILQMIMLIFSVAVGAIVYFVLCVLLRIKEMKVLVRGVLKR